MPTLTIRVKIPPGSNPDLQLERIRKALKSIRLELDDDPPRNPEPTHVRRTP